MAYNNTSQQSYWAPTDHVHLKPIPYATARPASLYSTNSNNTYDAPYYKPLDPSSYDGGDDLARIATADNTLKNRIRILRIASRTFATILSGATIAPLAMTLIKFFQTRNTYYLVDGVERTAWAADTRAWYTYMYMAVSVVSFLLNLAILISYCRGVKQANATAKYAGYWSTGIIVVHVVVWGVSVGIYRYGKEPVNGEFKDLWGWTCSKAADAIQEQIADVNFAQYCTVQSTSFYTGIANTVSGLLSAAIYIFALMRLRSKKRVQHASFRVDEAREPLRQ